MKHPTNLENKHLKYVTFRLSKLALAFRVLMDSTKKLISGRYLGEILRLVICELIDEGVLFLGQNTYKLEKAYVFDTAFLSLMERSEPIVVVYAGYQTDCRV
jgi:hexokinase